MAIGIVQVAARSDLYITTAAVIPVLWVAIGFGGSSVRSTFIHLNQIATGEIRVLVLPKRLIRMSFTVSTVSLTFWCFGKRQLQLMSFKEEELVMAISAAVFITGVLVAGAFGESLSLLGLFWSSNSELLASTVLVLTFVLVILTMLALTFSLTAVATSTGFITNEKGKSPEELKTSFEDVETSDPELS